MTQKELDNLHVGDIISVGNDIDYYYDYTKGNDVYFHWYTAGSKKLCHRTYSINYLLEQGIFKRMGTLKEKYWKPGNIVKVVNGTRFLIINDGIMIDQDGYMESYSYDDYLKERFNPSWSITKVWSVDNWGAGWDTIKNIERFVEEDRHGARLLWSRPNTIEMTVSEIEKKLGLESGILRIKK